MLSVPVIGLLFGVFAALATAECPAPEFLEPLNCRCTRGSFVRCHSINTEKHLQLIMTACKGHELDEFTLVNTKLLWLPEDLFNHVNTKQFVLKNSNLDSLAKPDGQADLFTGTDINTLVLDNVTIRDEDLDPIKGLTELRNLGIRSYSHMLVVRQLERLLDVGQLRTLILEDIPALVWSDGALKSFEHLEFVSLSGVNLTKLSRSDFPDQVEHLQQIWLRNNFLSDVPADFFRGMEHLDTLDLSNNRITALDGGTFYNYFGALGLQGNPLRCDENLNWLKQRLLEKSLKLIFNQKVLCDDGTPLLDM